MAEEKKLSRVEQARARAEAAVERHGDQNDTTKGSVDFKTAPEGKHKAVLVGYVEQGPQAGTYKGQPKKPVNKFVLRFALYGKDCANDDGSPIVVQTRPISVGRGENGNAVKVFKALCPKADAKHFLELLGKAYWVIIKHTEGDKAGSDGKKPVFANIVEAELKPAVKEILDDDDNIVGYEDIKCPTPADNLYMIYEWDVPSKEDFETLTKSLQKKLRASTAFAGSALQQLVGDGDPEDKADDNDGAATNAPEGDEEESTPEPAAQEKAEETTPENTEVDSSQLPDL